MEYLSFNTYCRQRFGCKVYKLSLDAGFTCPNRDGTVSTGGCAFCLGGSGRFAVSGMDILQQLEQAKEMVRAKGGEKFIAYFQAYSNTYASPIILKDLFESAIAGDDIVALAVATRPDCLPADVVKLLCDINAKKPVFVELGLQTAHEEVAARMNRHFDNACYLHALTQLKQAHIHVVTHLIFGLPGESEADMLESVRFVMRAGTDGVKFHMLNVLKGTALERMYDAGEITLMSREAYARLVAKAVVILNNHVVVHRLTGDGDKRVLIAPEWVKDKRKTLNLIHHQIACIQQADVFADGSANSIVQ